MCLCHEDFVNALNVHPADGAHLSSSTTRRTAHKMFAGVEDDLHVMLHADLAQPFVSHSLIFSLKPLKICTERVDTA